MLGRCWAAVAVLGGAGFAAATGTAPWSEMPVAVLLDGWLPIAVAWGWLGIVVTGLAVYRPEWLQTFDADRYLKPPGWQR